ncbi:competence type IV pilus major pilin ComGC [Paraliobacillus sp. X-1268]|uniref:competence type IV pilus major pilin ComGC n=1 Tax=Paraliobacillus sp. X-1268 TaxID=2213193 RepID=UPI000E3E912D|nr:prepilin-type N-terminal cleavage/methylation domain-containing protein [Paraliobacillus sp. X-1268]
MLTRMRKMLRNEKGFTLVELLAVIVILGIIVAIAVPAIGNITEDARSNAAEAQEELILDAARLADVEGNFTSSSTTVQDLIDDGYLEDGDYVKTRVIYKDGGTYSFTKPTTTP